MTARTARTRHSGRQKPHGLPASALTVAYEAAHPGQVQHTQRPRADRRRAQLLAATGSVAPVTAPLVVPGLRPALTAGAAR